MSDKKPTVVSLFSGAGGMDLGFIQAGFDVVWANDVFKEAVATYKRNIGEHIVEKSICEIDSSEIPDNPDIVIGGFPCQGFSISNKNRSMQDERNFLYKELLRVVRDKQPKMFVAENVKGLMSMEKGKVLDMILTDFRDLGYHVEYRLLNAAEYGVPQARERIFIIGSRIKDYIVFPEQTHSLTETLDLPLAVTCKEAIGWLGEIPTQRELYVTKEGKAVYQHKAAENVEDTFYKRKYDVKQEEIAEYLKIWKIKKGLSNKQIDAYFGYPDTASHWFRKDRWGSIPKQEDWWGLKELLGFDDTYDEKVTTFVEKQITFDQLLRVTNWDRPSATITASTPAIYINRRRRMSVRECAILQTFPEDFIFCGKGLSILYKQIGNAVPVLMAKCIAETIKKQL